MFTFDDKAEFKIKSFVHGDFIAEIPTICQSIFDLRKDSMICSKSDTDCKLNCSLRAKTFISAILTHFSSLALTSEYESYLQNDLWHFDIPDINFENILDGNERIALIFEITNLLKRLFVKFSDIALLMLDIGEKLYYDIIGRNEIFDDECEVLLFTDTKEESALRYDHAVLILQIKIKKAMLYFMDAILVDHYYNPLMDRGILLTNNTSNKQKLLKTESSTFKQREHIWMPLIAKLNRTLTQLQSSFLFRYENATIKTVEDAVQYVPPADMIARATTDRYNRNRTNELYQLVKKQKRKDVNEMRDLDVEAQIKFRKEEITTNKLISYFGGALQEHIDIKKWYKSFYSPVYGHVVVLETSGLNFIPVETNSMPKTTITDNTQIVQPVMESGIPVKQCDIDWTISVLHNLWPNFHNMGVTIYKRNPFNESFISFVHKHYNNDYYPLDYKPFNTNTKSRIESRYKLTSEIGIIVSRLFHDMCLFNPRTLGGNNPIIISEKSSEQQKMEYDGFHTRFVFTELTTTLFRYLQNSVNFDAVVQNFNLIITKYDVIPYNIILLFGNVFRKFTMLQEFSSGIYDSVNDILTMLLTKMETTNVQEILLPETDQSQFVLLFWSINTLCPLSPKNTIGCASVSPIIGQDNDIQFQLFCEQQNKDVKSLRCMVEFLNLVNIKHNNSTMCLAAISFSATVIVNWCNCCDDTFTIIYVLNKKEIFEKVLIQQIPVVMLNEILHLIVKCFDCEYHDCYVSVIRLSCTIIRFLKCWLRGYELTVTVCGSTSISWQICPIFTKIMNLIEKQKSEWRKIVNVVKCDIIPHLQIMLDNSELHSHTEGYKNVEKAKKEIENMIMYGN
jgi:hypothetical protein